MMNVREMERWQMNAKDLHRRLILAPTPRERERWHALWLLAQGWTAAATADALGRDPHTIGRWAAAFGDGGPAALIFEQSGGSPPLTGVGIWCFTLRDDRFLRVRRRARMWFRMQQCSRQPVCLVPESHFPSKSTISIPTPVRFPPALGERQQGELRAAVQELPEQAGIELANWTWRVVHRFVSERFGISLGRGSCLNWLHRLGFAFKRPKKRLVKVDEAKPGGLHSGVALWDEAGRTGGTIFFVDEAHFRADAELRGKWALKGKPALVDSNSPRYGAKAGYYSAVCLETGEVDRWTWPASGSSWGWTGPGPVGSASDAHRR